MRIDKFLWFARLTKTRSAAQTIIAGGSMRIGGRRIDRASALDKAGDVLTFPSATGAIRIIRVEALPARRGPAAEARACYSDLARTD